MPKLRSVRLIRLAFALISPTPTLPLSPSRRERGGGDQCLPLLRMIMGAKSSSSSLFLELFKARPWESVLKVWPLALASSRSIFSVTFSNMASSAAVGSAPLTFPPPKILFMKARTSSRILISKITSMAMTISARSRIAVR